MQYAYEDRIAELRSQMDRLTSRKLLDQEQFEQKLDQLMRRQATLESRATTLFGAADPTPPARSSLRPLNRHRDLAGKALADQRYGHPHPAAGSRGTA